MKALKENYKRNVEILQENLKRGMSVSQAMGVVNNWRELFIKNDLFGEDEKEFIDACLELLETKTHLSVIVA